MGESGKNGFFEKTPEQRRFDALVESEKQEELSNLEIDREFELLHSPASEHPGIERMFQKLVKRADELAARSATKLLRAEKAGQLEKKTGLYRPEAFEELYILSVNHLEEGKKSALIAIDLDNFKNVNSIKGQDAGDALLERVGMEIKKSINKNDYACRFGGDEFLILANDLPEDFDVRKIVSKFAKAIADINPEDSGGPISISAGYITITEDTVPYFSAAQRTANEGAGLAKKLGRGRVVHVSGDTYTAFVRDTKTATYPDPTDDKKEEGSIKEFKASREQCDREVDISLQRVTEEIELHFGKKLPDILTEMYHVDDIGVLSKYQLGGLLHRARFEKQGHI